MASAPTTGIRQFGLTVGSMVPRLPSGSRPEDGRSRGRGEEVPTEARSRRGEEDDDEEEVDEIADQSEEEDEDEEEEGIPSTAADARREEEEDQEECRRLKSEADAACRRVGRRYDALVKFATGHPRGEYGEFVEFLLMGGGMSEGVGESGDEYLADLTNEDFYDENSACRKLWNDNLTLGLPGSASTMEGRAFVPAANAGSSSKWAHGTLSDDEGRGYLGKYLRERTLSAEGERIKNQIVQVDRQRIKQGLGTAVNVISNVSSFALKPLRDLQLAEKLNALNIDMEEEEARKEIAQYNRMQEERREMEDMMRLKREAETSCLNATTEHLLGFVRDNPDAKYQQWIEDLHPENAHDGTLLEGMGKTIDHRFFVEESDHRRIWNDNLFTLLEPDRSTGRDFVPARARQMDENGESVVAADILSGSPIGRKPTGRKQIPIPPQDEVGKSEENSMDLMQFDW